MILAPDMPESPSKFYRRWLQPRFQKNFELKNWLIGFAPKAG